jgi:hypothetical protein
MMEYWLELFHWSSEKNMTPLGSHLNNLCMHLPNYAINKETDGFVQIKPRLNAIEMEVSPSLSQLHQSPKAHPT